MENEISNEHVVDLLLNCLAFANAANFDDEDFIPPINFWKQNQLKLFIDFECAGFEVSVNRRY
jgi:hypothetical protein